MAVLERKMLTTLIDHLEEKEFSILTGPRQSGKTTLLNQLAERLKQREEEVYSFNWKTNRSSPDLINILKIYLIS